MIALRRAVVLAVVCGAVLIVSACSPTAPRPAPSPTTPAALSDAEAFAAAERTYRAYVDALNDVDLADPATFEPVFALTTGELLENSRRTFAEMTEKSWQVSGASRVALAVATARDGREVLLEVCLDVSDVVVTAPSGEVVTPADRRPMQKLEVAVDVAAHDLARVLATGARETGAPC